MGRNRNNPGTNNGKQQSFNPHKNKNIHKNEPHKQNDPMRKSSKNITDPKNITAIEPSKPNKPQDSLRITQTKSIDQKICPPPSQHKPAPTSIKPKTICDGQKFSQVK